MSLRARVLLGAALTALVLLVGTVVTTRAIERQLVAQVDDRLVAALGPGGELVGRFGGPGRPTPSDGAPGRLSELYAGVVTADGVVIVQTPDVGADRPAPAIDVRLATASATTGEAFTAPATSGDDRFRVLAVNGLRGRVGLVALPLDDVDAAVRRLGFVQVAVTAAVVGVVALVAWWVLHLGVRPIKAMTEVATTIAAGDLSRRVPDDAARGTEAAALGDALNAMLGRIEGAFDERARSDERLRRFVADASHELRTPVTTIRGYAELYRAGGLAEPASLDEAMRRTEQEAVRMGNLVEDLLQLARLDEGRPLGHDPVDLAALALDAAADARAVDPDRPVAADAPAPVVVLGDEDRLRQVLANVVGNALVHTPADVPISIRVAAADGRARVEVTDEGPGMPADVAGRAFERFYRADPSRSRHRGGSGLGLSIVEAVVGAHGGTVALESAPGAGTIVRIELPVAPG